MAETKEFREFFLRATLVTSGTKPDQEGNFPTTYYIGTTLVYNRFLKNHYPSEKVFRKLFESITFKLNKEDTAQLTVQGLGKIATDANAIARTSNNSSNDFTAFVIPHQLPELVQTETGGTDVIIGSASTVDGITLTKYTRTVSSLARLIWKIRVAIRYSLEFSSGIIQLKNDVDAPGNDYFYGTDGVGAKAWRSFTTLFTSLIEAKIRAVTAGTNYDDGNKFTLNTNTATVQLVTGCSVTIPADGDYVIINDYRVTVDTVVIVAFKIELKKNGASGTALGQPTIHVKDSPFSDYSGLNTFITGLVAGDTIDLVMTPVIQGVSTSAVYNRTTTILKVK